MRALIYLLGARAVDVAGDGEPRRSSTPEPALPPIASTPDQGAAWRRWAEAGRTATAGTAGPVPIAAGLSAARGGPA